MISSKETTQKRKIECHRIKLTFPSQLLVDRLRNGGIVCRQIADKVWKCGGLVISGQYLMLFGSLVMYRKALDGTGIDLSSVIAGEVQ